MANRSLKTAACTAGVLVLGTLLYRNYRGNLEAQAKMAATVTPAQIANWEKAAAYQSSLETLNARFAKLNGSAQSAQWARDLELKVTPVEFWEDLISSPDWPKLIELWNQSGYEPNEAFYHLFASFIPQAGRHPIPPLPSKLLYSFAFGVGTLIIFTFTR